jgi:hypothetical protein
MENAEKSMCFIGPPTVDKNMLLNSSRESRKRGDDELKRAYKIASNLSNERHRTQKASGSLKEKKYASRQESKNKPGGCDFKEFHQRNYWLECVLQINKTGKKGKTMSSSNNAILLCVFQIPNQIIKEIIPPGQNDGGASIDENEMKVGFIHKRIKLTNCVY